MYSVDFRFSYTQNPSQISLFLREEPKFLGKSYILLAIFGLVSSDFYLGFPCWLNITFQEND